jgi:hypothetical protein
LRVGFYAEGSGPHLAIAKHLIASVRKHMPDVEIAMLTDGVTEAPMGVEAIRIAEDMPMGVRRLTHYSRLKGDWVFVDTDVVFRKDVSDVFAKPFDVAVASREGTYMAGTQYAELMPYNFGVVFSKNPEFWGMLLPHLRKMSPEEQRWGGEQLLTCQLIHQQDSCFSVEILPSAYNFTPYRQEDDVSHAAILHLKGARKGWITTYL